MVDSETDIPTILLVDDNEDMLVVAGTILRQAGYNVRPVSSGRDALQSIERHGMPHLAVVDIAMPLMDGIELSYKLKSLGELPIILLTAQSQEKILVKAIEDFADDYIVKPFHSKELVARIKRVLRRVEDFDYTAHTLDLGESSFQFDFKNREVVEGDSAVSLTPTEAKLLYLLMRNNKRYVHVEVLMAQIWPTKNVPEERLRVHISRLRGKLQSLPSSKDYILTERGRGYRFQG